MNTFNGKASTKTNCRNVLNLCLFVVGLFGMFCLLHITRCLLYLYTCRLADKLAGRLTGWLAGWLASWQVYWLTGRFAGWQAGLLVGSNSLGQEIKSVFDLVFDH